jgi:hypothetical protein
MSHQPPSDFWRRKGESDVWHPRPSNKPKANEIGVKRDGGPRSPARVDDVPGLSKIRTASQTEAPTNSGAIPNHPVSFDMLVHETHDSLTHTQKASRCLMAENPDP